MGAHTGSPCCSCARTLSLMGGTEGGARPYQAPRGTLKQPAVDRQDVARFLADCVTSKEWDNKAVSLQGGLRGGCVSYRGQDYELQKVELVQANVRSSPCPRTSSSKYLGVVINAD